MPIKFHIVKATVFLGVMYGCESWIVRKAEHQRIDAFELWCWRRLLRIPFTPRRSYKLILKEISPEYSLEGLMLKRKLQYFSHLMWRANSLEKTLMLGKIEGKRRKRWQRMRWLDSITDSMDMSLNQFQDIVKDRDASCASESRTRLNDSTTIYKIFILNTNKNFVFVYKVFILNTNKNFVFVYKVVILFFFPYSWYLYHWIHRSWVSKRSLSAKW